MGKKLHIIRYSNKVMNRSDNVRVAIRIKGENWLKWSHQRSPEGVVFNYEYLMLVNVFFCHFF